MTAGPALLLLGALAQSCSIPPTPTESSSALARPSISASPAPAASTSTAVDVPVAPHGPTSSPTASCGGGRKLTVHFYDVGQALAALVDLPDRRHLLVDTGDSPRRPGCGQACASADQHLLDGLRADLHGASLDLLWITHQHSDHIGGAPEVLDRFNVSTYVDNGRDVRKSEVLRAHRAAEEHGTVVRVIDPEHADPPVASSADVKVTPIVPASWPGACAHDANECSIALRIDFCSSSVLFTGDAEHDEEAHIDTRGRVTLLQVAHHGSETSTTPGFLSKVHPRYAVISAGKPGEGINADYCHPRALIVKRLTAVIGGPGSKTVRAFDGDRCAGSQASDWVDVASSDRLWATERDGDVVLSTIGDGTFVRERGEYHQ